MNEYLKGYYFQAANSNVIPFFFDASLVFIRRVVRKVAFIQESG